MTGITDQQPPPGARSQADAIVALGQFALAFGRVNRITYHPDGRRPETDTDHTVMLVLVSCALAAQQPELDLDWGMIAQFAAVHDLVEVYAGDTPTLRALAPDARAAKRAREAAAFQRIAAEFADLPWLPAIIDAYEQRSTPEARWVWAVDKLLPKITHLGNGCATLREQGVDPGELAERYELQARELGAVLAEFPVLGEIRRDLVDRVLTLYRARNGTP